MVQMPAATERLTEKDKYIYVIEVNVSNFSFAYI